MLPWLVGSALLTWFGFQIRFFSDFLYSDDVLEVALAGVS